MTDETTAETTGETTDETTGGTVATPTASARGALARDDIPGWGIDADPLNDPTYPMRDRSRDDGAGLTWDRPSLQDSGVEVLQSVEHLRRPAVYGTSTPPRGLSGGIRRVAFRYSESQWARWLLLMLADRVDMGEGLIEDVARGKLPNLARERGTRAVRMYDRKAYDRGVVTSVAVVGAVAGVSYLLLRRRPTKRRAVRPAPALRPAAE